jgi:hypothetical protein
MTGAVVLAADITGSSQGFASITNGLTFVVH